MLMLPNRSRRPSWGQEGSSRAYGCLQLVAVMGLFGLLAIGWLRPVSATTPLDKDASAWQPLFNGKDLTGWVHLGGGQAKVEKGILIMQNDTLRQPGYLLCTHASPHNFEIRMRCRVLAGDSGLFFRCQRHPLHQQEVMGLQVQLNVQPRSGLGGIFEHHGRGWVQKTPDALHAQLTKDREWLHVYLYVKGQRIWVQVNEVTTVDFMDSESENQKQPANAWALQIHGGCPCHIEVQTLEYRRLP